jgi:Big-like domain-containing protein
VLPIKSMALAASLAAGAAVSVYAQETKPVPGGVASRTERLSAPAKVTAVQDSPEFIRVVWSAVEGATRYTMTRSVPPAGAAPVTLPNTPDTVYIDRDVQPGKTYYYLLGAVNEAGIVGLKAGAPPVTARAPVPQPPSAVKAVLSGQNVALTWTAVGGYDLEFDIERAQVTGDRPLGGVRVIERNRCCSASSSLEGVPSGTRVVYLVRARNRFGDLSERAMSNEITVPLMTAADTTSGGGPSADTTAGGPSSDTTAVTTRVLPAVIAPRGKLRVGGPALNLGAVPAFKNLRLQKTRWVSLDQGIATVTGDGRVRGRSAGSTFVVVNGVTAEGAVGSMVARIDVAAR